MAIIFDVKEGEPPESIIKKREILLHDFVSHNGNLKTEFYGQYFPVIDQDYHPGKRNIVLKVLENDEKISPYDKIGYYLLI